MITKMDKIQARFSRGCGTHPDVFPLTAKMQLIQKLSLMSPFHRLQIDL